MNRKAAYILVGLVTAAGIALAAFTLDTFRTLQTSVAGLTTNLCTNVVINVDEFDTVGLQFRGALAGTGGDTMELVFRRGLNTNTIDKANYFTWTFPTAGWVSGTTNYASTNLVSVRDFRALSAYSIGNGNTGAMSAVQLSYGSK